MGRTSLSKSVVRLGQIAAAALLILALAAPPVLAQASQLTIGDTRIEGFPKVTLRLTVGDASGGAVGGLGPGDFVIEENGQRIDSLSAYPLRQSPTPLAIVLAVDVSGSMADEAKLDRAREAAKAFVSQLRSIDQVELVRFGDNVGTVVPFTRDRRAIERGLDSLTPRGNTPLYDATNLAVTEVLRVEGKRIVVVLTDGADTNSTTPLSQALELAAQTQVPIYTIGLGGEVRDDVLSRMAQETAGRYFKAPRPEDLSLTFRRLSQQIDNQYELYYFSPLAQEPGRKVDVVVRLAGTEGAEARFSYVIPVVRRDPGTAVDPGVLRPVVEAPSAEPARTPAAPPFWVELAGLSAAGAVLALFAGIVYQMTRDAREVRLATFVQGVARPAVRRGDAPTHGRLLFALVRGLAGIVERFLPGRQIEQMRHNLLLAGHPYGWGVEEFLGVRVLLAILLGGLAYVAAAPRGPAFSLLMAIVLGLLGFLLPAIWLGWRIRARQKEIVRAMPNALDLLSVSVEAGLGFDQAVTEVCQKWHNALTREFTILLGELQMGRSRRDALRALMERTGVPELGSFASALIQADELGASIARTLNIQADQLRIKRRQRAEREAHEAAIKMLFPLVFLMFPSLFIVILGPAVPTILEAFAGLRR